MDSADKPVPPAKKRRRAADGLLGTNRPGGLHERVYRSLVHAILSGKYASGVRLPTEADLATAYSVSRPVLRQALDRLRAERLTTSRRGSGNFVMDAAELAAASQLSNAQALTSLQRMMDDMEFRAVIEPEAAFLAARRRIPADLQRMDTALKEFEAAYLSASITHHFDFLFHEALALATTNQQFVSAIRVLEYGSDDSRILVRNIIHFQPSARGATVLKEHVEIFELIERRDDVGARHAMSNHIEAAKLRLARHIQSLSA